MMDARAYRRHLDALGLLVSGKETCALLGITDRASREYAREDGAAYPVARSVELALRLMVRHSASPGTWIALLDAPATIPRPLPPQHFGELRPAFANKK